MLLRRRSGVPLDLVVCGVLFLALACAVYWPVSPIDGTHVVGGCACSDAVQQVWFLRWTAFALGHGLDPLTSDYLNAPAGVNLAVNTSMPLLGVLGWPVTAVADAVVAFNLLLRLGLAASALSMYVVLRRYVRTRSAAFVGGLLFGFSPYMLGEGQLHVFLVFLPLVPPLIPLVDGWLVRADRNPYRSGALIGLVLGLEMLISIELTAVLVILGVIVLVPIAIRHHRLVRSRLPALARGVVPAVLVGAAVGGYAAWMFVAGPQRPLGPPHSVANLDSYHADLLSLILPSSPQLIEVGRLRAITDGFVRGNTHENGFYLGIPLLLVLVVGAVRLRRSTLVLGFAVLGVTSFVLSLGTTLTIAGGVTPIPLPFAVITGIPALQEIGPTRFALAIQLAAAVLLAVVLDGCLQRFATTRVRAVALVVAALAVLVPLLPNGPIRSTTVPATPFFSTGAVREILAGTTVLPYPFASPASNVSMLWQAASGMRFRMPGGEVYVPGPTGRSTNYPHGGLPQPLWAVLVQGGPQRTTQWRPPSAAQRAGLVVSLQRFVSSSGVGAMVVRSGGAQGRWVASLARSAFGDPTSVHGDVSVWIRPVARRAVRTG